MTRPLDAHAAALRAVPPRRKTGPKSVLETLLAFQIARERLGQPVREFRFHPPRMWRFDFCFGLEGLAIEIDGGTWTGGRHVTGVGFERDCAKYNQAQIDGWIVLRFTGDMVRDGRAIRTIAEALAVLR